MADRRGKLWCPPGVKSSELLPLFLKKGVVIAGGLGAEKGLLSTPLCSPTVHLLTPFHLLLDNYFRIG